MALVTGTNCGFVRTAPTADPAGGAPAGIDTWSVAIKATAPAGPSRIVEMGWWCDNATEAANYQLGLYSDAGAGEPELRLQRTSDTAKGITAGWKVVTGLDWRIEANTVYWLAVQLDDTATATNMDTETSGGPGGAILFTETELVADWGTSDFVDADNNGAIYAVIVPIMPRKMASHRRRRSA